MKDEGPPYHEEAEVAERETEKLPSLPLIVILWKDHCQEGSVNWTKCTELHGSNRHPPTKKFVCN